jgi:haloalkane dehalogenase
MRTWFGSRPQPSPPGFMPLARRRVTTAAGEVAAVDKGSGPPLVFLHGGVIASDYWRNIIPELSDNYRCLAVDLPGTGSSTKSQRDGDPYTLESQTEAFAEAIDALAIESPVVLIVHGWASMVGFHWASNFQSRVRAIAHMESVVSPLAWPNLPDRLRAHLRFARTSPAAIYSMDYLDEAMKIEVSEPLSGPVVEAYRKVWEAGYTHRQAQIQGFRQIPISGKPATSQQMVLDYQAWLQQTLIPKLLIIGRPGMFVTQEGPAHRMWNQTVVGVVGAHLLAEESPDDITLFLSAWIRQHVFSPRPGAANTPE